MLCCGKRGEWERRSDGPVLDQKHVSWAVYLGDNLSLTQLHVPVDHIFGVSCWSKWISTQSIPAGPVSSLCKYQRCYHPVFSWVNCRDAWCSSCSVARTWHLCSLLLECSTTPRTTTTSRFASRSWGARLHNWEEAQALLHAQAGVTDMSSPVYSVPYLLEDKVLERKKINLWTSSYLITFLHKKADDWLDSKIREGS